MRSAFSRRSVLVMLGSATVAGASGIGPIQGAPVITVHKDAACGCCSQWGRLLEQAGLPVHMIDSAELMAVKARLGVPDDLQSCHTGEIGAYVVEGHVPVAAIRRLLREAPEAKGIAVPGMPAGAPGMEGGSDEVYDVILFGSRGRRNFGRFHGSREL